MLKGEEDLVEVTTHHPVFVVKIKRGLSNEEIVPQFHSFIALVRSINSGVVDGTWLGLDRAHVRHCLDWKRI